MKKVIVFFIVVLVGCGSLLAYNMIAGNQKAEKLASDLQAAKDALNTGAPQEAIELLTPIWETIDNKDVREKVGYMLFTAYQKTGNHEKVVALGEEYSTKFPGNINVPAVKVAVLDSKLESGVSVKELLPELQVLADEGDLKARNMIMFYEAEEEYKKGDLAQAREKFWKLYDLMGENNELTPKVEKRLGEINVKLIFSDQIMPEDSEYTIVKGDSLYNIAKKNGVPLDLLNTCNGINNPNALRIGQKLKIPKCDFEILVDKSTNILVVKNNGRFFKKYRVRTGRTDDLTPNGTYTIQNKKKNPTWRRPSDGKEFKPGDPENELGTRWMSFWKDRLGIHGTIKPETIGKYSSSGCVGLLKDDVEELFDYITIGTPIKIVGEKNDDLALAN